jgi:hypothetical protein
MIREIKRIGSVIQYRVWNNGIAHVRVMEGVAQIALIRLPSDEQGQGLGSQAYRDIGAHLKAQGITLRSSDHLTDATRAIWQGLAADGLAQVTDAGWEWL